MLCKACLKIFRRREDFVFKAAKIFKLHHTTQSFHQAASHRCHICSILWQFWSNRDLARFKQALSSNSHRSHPLVTSYTIQHISGQRTPSIVLEFSLYESCDGTIPFYSLPTYSYVLELKESSVNPTFTEPNLHGFMPQPSFTFLTRTTSTNASIDSCWPFLERCFSNCRENHSKCKRAASLAHSYPNRFLELDFKNPEGMIRLCHTKHFTSLLPYMTLSHPWGSMSDAVFKLMEGTLQELEKGILITSLPTCYQDAIRLANKFGISYLWIDSLCIMQDQLDDWEREASIMADIYNNSIINISATKARNSNETLFAKRDPMLVDILQVTASWGTQYILHRKDLWHDEVDSAPLNQRGWVLQVFLTLFFA